MLQQRFRVMTLALLLTGANAFAAPPINLHPVPPQGIDTLDPAGLRYYQEMGPLEFAARLLPEPSYPAWRLHLAMYPVIDAQDQILSGYRVEASRINLSTQVYATLKQELGEENVDPAFKDNTASDRFTLPFMIVQNVTADPLTEQFSQDNAVPTDKPCGLQTDCGQYWQEAENADWGQEQTLAADLAPWEQQIQSIPALLRALAKQANWLQAENGHWIWVTPEMPESVNADQPWVEITIDNHAGNGGLLLADWLETVADDSIRASAVRALWAEEALDSVQTFRAKLCARTDTPLLPVQTCP